MKIEEIIHKIITFYFSSYLFLELLIKKKNQRNVIQRKLLFWKEFMHLLVCLTINLTACAKMKNS